MAARTPRPKRVGYDPTVHAKRKQPVCCYCRRAAEGNYAIHMYGIGDGPELDLCDACGAFPFPTCEEIWRRIHLMGTDKRKRER